MPGKKSTKPTNGDPAVPPIVIVGTGPAGIHAARELLRREPSQAIVIYGAEPWEPYNRVRLSELLAGEIDFEDIANTLEFTSENSVSLRINTPVTSIDRTRKTVTDGAGQQQHYKKLIMCTGSEPYRPNIRNIDLLGVYTYRDVDDAQTLMTNCVQSHHTVVLGGGVLGMEVAFALSVQNPATEITIVHRSEQLMNRNLDEDASEVLKEQVLFAGLNLNLGATIVEIIGENELQSIRLGNGDLLDCDTLILCTGINPNIDLARDCGLRLARGIKVNDHLRTSDASIYAVGECAEHRGRTYALLGPCLEQASVAAYNVLYGDSQTYLGSNRSLRVKVKELPIFILEPPEDLRESSAYHQITFTNAPAGRFRRVFLNRGRLAGAVAIGDWPELVHIHEATKSRRRIWPWQRYRFARYGTIWPERRRQNPLNWPDAALVCTCAGVTRGDLGRAISEGYRTPAELSDRTGAGQACASCLPYVSLIAGSPVEMKAPPPTVSQFAISGIAAILSALIIARPPIGPPTSAINGGFLANLWQNNLWQQVSGYVLLGTVLVSMILSLRKRWNYFSFASFEKWRMLHLALATLSLLFLVLHTGLNGGDNLNFKLMVIFLATAISGIITALLISWEDMNGGILIRTIRTWCVRVHIIIIWILFAFVPIHILAVYYF